MLFMLAKVLVASAALAAVCAASLHWWLGDWATQAFLPKLGALLATVVTGVVVFLGCGALLKIEELDGLIAAFKRRLQRAR
jgi:peptidoglycan biosynthesis protein MviN/MurJ (putative lipid II flippase)